MTLTFLNVHQSSRLYVSRLSSPLKCQLLRVERFDEKTLNLSTYFGTKIDFNPNSTQTINNKGSTASNPLDKIYASILSNENASKKSIFCY